MTFPTPSVRNEPNLIFFQAYISLNSRLIEQKYSIHLLKMVKTIY